MWLADVLGKTIKSASGLLPDRKILRFLGGGVSVSDNPTNGSTDVTISAQDAQWPPRDFPSFGKINVFHVIEDFLQASKLQGLGSVVSGTGAAVGVDTQAAPGRIGISYASTGTTATGYARIATGQNAVRLGEGAFRCRADVMIPVLGDAVDTFRVFSGLSDADNPSTDGIDAIGFRYSHDINGGKWRFYSSEASVTTVLDSTILVAADEWYSLEIEVNADATEAKAWINGVSIGTITTNIPNGSNLTGFVPIGIAKSVGTTDRKAYIDLASWAYYPSTPL